MLTDEEFISKGADPSVWRRFSVAPGRILVVREGIDAVAWSSKTQKPDYAPAMAEGERYAVLSRVKGPGGQDLEIVDPDRKMVDVLEQFEPWATVLMIGEARNTEYGTRIRPPAVKPGQRVMISPTGGQNITLRAGEAAMRVTLIPFEGIVLIDNGEPEAAS